MIEGCSLTALEKSFFGTLNDLLLPGVREGWLSRAELPATPVALAVPGRKSGKIRTLPLLAVQLGDVLLVSTFRGERSQWIRNVAAAQKVKVWLGGRAKQYDASVLGPGLRSRRRRKRSREILGLLEPATAIGWSFAVLEPAVRRAA